MTNEKISNMVRQMTPSAFPLIIPPDFAGMSEGLSKREFYAAMAMQALIPISTDHTRRGLITTAVILADALIEELAKDGV